MGSNEASREKHYIYESKLEFAKILYVLINRRDFAIKINSRTQRKTLRIYK